MPASKPPGQRGRDAERLSLAVRMARTRPATGDERALMAQFGIYLA